MSPGAAKSAACRKRAMSKRGRQPSTLKPVPRPVWNAETVRHVIGGLVIARHGCRGRPGEVVVQDLPQRIIAGQADIGERLIEAGDGTAIHFRMLSVPAVHPDDGGLVTTGIGIR